MTVVLDTNGVDENGVVHWTSAIVNFLDDSIYPACLNRSLSWDSNAGKWKHDRQDAQLRETDRPVTCLSCLAMVVE